MSFTLTLFILRESKFDWVRKKFHSMHLSTPKFSSWGTYIQQLSIVLSWRVGLGRRFRELLGDLYLVDDPVDVLEIQVGNARSDSDDNS